MKTKICLQIVLLLFPFLLHAQQQSLTAGEIAAGIEKLGVSGRVLYIAAHPDDENTRLLAYFAKERKFKTGYLSLTRGDGGQNLIGNEQAELLGLIRTQELLAARRVDGAEQFFTRANDFGFSKTSDESFTIWGKEQILADVVWVIRKFRPDVIITRFPEDSRAGHGHHAGSAILAREAFAAAADPKRFPEQLKTLSPWQAKRIVWNTFNFGGNNTTAPDQLKMDVGLFNPILGKSYGEIAAISRTNHKSQGFGSTLQRGEAFEYFSPVAGEPAKKDLFEDINTAVGTDILQSEAWQGLQKQVSQTQNPALWLPYLLQLHKTVKDKRFDHALLNQLILACAGIWIEANTPQSNYAAGDSIPLNLQAIRRSSADLNAKITFGGKTFDLAHNRMLSTGYTIATHSGQLTQPYWLKAAHGIGRFEVNDQQLIGYPENPDLLSIPVTLQLNDQTIELNYPVVYKSTDPIKGERYQPLIIAPRVTATLTEKVYLFKDNTPKTVTVQLHNFGTNSSGQVSLQLPAGWTSSPRQVNFNFKTKGEEQTIQFTLHPAEKTGGGELSLTILANGQTGYEALRQISYDHIPNITLFPRATARLEKIDLKTTGKHIAYIEGAGDLVADALKQMGYEVSILTTAQLTKTNLSAYDAIVTGVRLYNISEEMKVLQPRLLQYVAQGGTLLVQYNVNNGLKTSAIGPYPFKLVNKRVTEEQAAVSFLDPADPVLNYPNKINKSDFDGWIQERGLYFASDMDPKYRTPLSMSDRGENASNGSLLISDYGKGKFVYTSLVFFRELPAGVPGAYRLFANLLAAPKH